ncbi:MAG: hypothetical protein UX88_C0029G0003 [Candidatus Woesebacteria bacterium GW2011_GWC2_47_16]|uniref:Uncharacterized protein n=6 Tax=Candidatus Woeseibacteriota TaxID=1752722 RepID=A0A0G1QWH7_9BACT|nr:MAG: hypothetical protein UX03_C0013G0050 [Candidatus Woesebacteria bacterium GW2011_GWE1_45_18]KKU23174.1 MAG: hypothetical protein UX34_C0015G0004 [Candidatus Woesebacteria bacterium GW2011_GWF1_46_13]KKU49224.1 MAG: hypothetical protein UX67_C0003G0011 [Candidatus Woesebacteria bacterium GW2011_GWF2_46_8]KKU63480.1 MAG: hypothetical protein UX88_C0029G0003 [Candidatus Woesebacteria bacterium GW2011_GWC2_47_16]OGM78423.1 MAG: hypothetical protein A2197_02940 [Candidatus Woesebacteria bacte
MKRRFAFTSVLVIAALLLAAVPAAADEGPEVPYIVIAEDGMTADYIPADGFVTVAIYAEMCNEAVFDEGELWLEDWSWISLPEVGEGPLGYLSAFLLQWDEEEEEWVEWGWISASRPCVEPPEEVGSVCFEGNATHVVGLNGWMVADTLASFVEGGELINYMPEPPSEAHETWEDEVVYADAFFVFWDGVLENWIWSDLIVGGPCEAAPAPPEPVVMMYVAYSATGFYGTEPDITNTITLYSALGAPAPERVAYWAYGDGATPDDLPEDWGWACSAMLLDDGNDRGLFACDASLKSVGERRANLRNDIQGPDFDLEPKIERYYSQLEALGLWP